MIKETKTSVKPIDKRIVEIFEPKPYDNVIQPRLINIADLKIPRKWIFQNITEAPVQKKIKIPTMVIQASDQTYTSQM